MDKGAKSPIRRWLIRAAGSAVVLALLAWFLPVAEIVAGFARVPPLLFAGVWAAFVAGHAMAAGKWWALLGRALAYPVALQAHVAGLAANLCLPGAAGGDVVRAGAAQLAVRDGGRVISGSVADRLIDMMALAILTAAGALELARGGDWSAMALEVLGFMVLGLVAVLWVLPWAVPWIWQRVPALPARDLALRTATEFSALARRPLLLIGTLVLSVAIQGMFVWLAMRLGLAVGVTVAPAAWYFAWPLAKLLAILPISLNGLGLREATLAGLMVPLGANGADVVAAGLVWQAVLFATGGLGALVLAMSGFRLRAQPAPVE